MDASFACVIVFQGISPTLRKRISQSKISCVSDHIHHDNFCNCWHVGSLIWTPLLPESLFSLTSPPPFIEFIHPTNSQRRYQRSAVVQITSISMTSVLDLSMSASWLGSKCSQSSSAPFVSSSSTHRRLFQHKCWKEHWPEIGWKGIVKKERLFDPLLGGLSIIICFDDTFSLTEDIGFTCSSLYLGCFTLGELQKREGFAYPLLCVQSSSSN